MRLMILPADNVIFIDGVGKALNCNFLRNRSEVKVISWFDSAGSIQYTNGSSRSIGSIDRQLPDGWSLQQLINMARSFGER